ncbi:MAG: ATP-binding cassette domain-containing protein [Actinobacteria bacterium]|uniref:Unannotated protein n=1 Tax=freshwater metagenome TaxID=449393 RepID=A0A6J7ECY1_9ZZZZ|nr:ATP-binding cassette domain-containing protein [Actinomycetota bacterium]
MTSGPPVEVRGLTKQYGDITAVDGVDLTVEAGDVFGYLGPNGAGKTTSMRMMLGLIRPTAGEVKLFGKDPQESISALTGVAGFVEAPRFYPYLDAKTNLELLAALDGDGANGRIPEVLDIVELTDRAKDKVGGYSHGMRQRLGIAASLLRKPKLLMLDEPATGLDPAGMRDMRLLIKRLASEGITVLLSSHLLAEVEDVCDRVAIIRKGKIAYQGQLSQLRKEAGLSYSLRTTDDTAARKVLDSFTAVTDVAASDDGTLRFHPADESAVAQLSGQLTAAGAMIIELAPRSATLEELFFELTEGES